MKQIASWILIALLIFLVLVVTASIKPAALPKAALSGAGGDEILRSYLQKIEGNWVDEGYAQGLSEGQLMQEPHPGLMLDIQANRIQDHQAMIVVSEYCRPDLAEYLRFRLEDGQLVYSGAAREGCYFDIPQIDFIRIRRENETEAAALIYEASETEHENYQQERMLRNPAPEVTAWHCGLQTFLTRLLRSGNSTIYDAAGRELSLAEAMGSEAAAEELSYVERYTLYWPMYEEVCVRADFEIVVFGSLQPGGSAAIYAIEWGSEDIRLYETQTATSSRDGFFPLQKGKLRFRIVENAPALSPSL
ncbi:MAG: hypothetical protein EAZ89_17340 [Bacteroidetes bacterium]|nr:MAG: hypothetical protein EAZ89_17340 [Bacteroidota bacterium]